MKHCKLTVELKRQPCEVFWHLIPIRHQGVMMEWRCFSWAVERAWAEQLSCSNFHSRQVFSLCIPHCAVPCAGRLTWGRGDNEETDGWVWTAAPCWWSEAHPAPGAPWWEQELQGLRGRLGQPVLRTPEGCVSDTAKGSGTQMCNQGGFFVSVPALLWLQLLWHLHLGVVAEVGSAHQLPQLSFGSCIPGMQHHDLSSQGPRSPHWGAGARNSSCSRSGVEVCNRHSTVAFIGVLLTCSPGTAYSSHAKCLTRIWGGSRFPPSYRTNQITFSIGYKTQDLDGIQ